MAKDTIEMTYGGTCKLDREIMRIIAENTLMYCRANKMGHHAEILEVKPGKRHQSEDAYRCIDGWFEVWVKFRCR